MSLLGVFAASPIIAIQAMELPFSSGGKPRKH
jgi:hypothetical protein